MKSKVTIKDIAKELDISVSTVSRALQDNPAISEDTRQKVKAFAELYNYKPNKLALKLRNRKTMVIGVIIPEIVHHFFSEVIGGIEKIANGEDYNVMICVSNESYNKEVLNVKMLTENSVDGLIVSISKETLEKKEFSHFKELNESNTPLVLFDRTVEEFACDQVVADDIGGGKLAAGHLMETGCNEMLILTTPDYVNVGRLRRMGYEKALADAHFPADHIHVLKIDEKHDLREQIEQMIAANNTWPLGIFAVNEIYAATAMKIVKKKGLNIPDAVAIIGYTNGLISEFSDPPLSTIVQHGAYMGEQAANLLLKRIESLDEEYRECEKIVVPADIVIRASSKKNQKITL